MRSHTLRFTLSLVGFVVVAAIARAQAQPSLSELEIADKVRIAILKLPYYGVFDLIAFEVHGSTVTLGGEVYRPSLKKEAEDAVKKIPGVTQVINKIEVLPVSIDDDRIRMELFRKIYSDDFLSKYGTPLPGLDGLRFSRHYWGRGFGAWPGFRTGVWGRAPFLGMEPLGNYGIHIIVKNGNVALFGTVSSEVDKTKAGLDARSVFGVHSVDNEIQVVRD
jgi:hyperosmotically inducible periplasmic protein